MSEQEKSVCFVCIDHATLNEKLVVLADFYMLIQSIWQDSIVRPMDLLCSQEERAQGQAVGRTLSAVGTNG